MEFKQHVTLRMGKVITVWSLESTVGNKLAKYWTNSLDEVRIGSLPSNKKNKWFVTVKPSERELQNVSDAVRKMIAYQHPNAGSLLTIVRLVGELLIKVSLSQGTVWIHGSAFQVCGKTILVVGRKGIGKTTWLATALILMGGAFIGNDLVPLEEICKRPSVRRWRPDIKLRPSTLHFLGRPLAISAVPDRLIWMVTCGSRETFDANEHRISRSGETVDLYLEDPPNLATLGCHPIDAVVIPHEKGPPDGVQLTTSNSIRLWAELIKDPDMTMPGDLNRWHDLRPWASRIAGLKTSEEAKRQSQKRIQRLSREVPNYWINHRAEIKSILTLLRGIISVAT